MTIFSDEALDSHLAKMADVTAANAEQIPPTEQFMILLSQKFSTLREMLSEANVELVTLSNRLFGSDPTAANNAGATGAKFSGQTGDCLVAVDAFIAQASAIRLQALRLNGLI